MYAVALIRYRRPVEQVVMHQDRHRAYLQELKTRGVLLASGPLEPRFGGMLLLRVPDDNVDAALDDIRDNDPYVRAGVVQYELLGWNPLLGRDGLDTL